MLSLTVRDGFASTEEIAAALAAWPAEGWHVYGDHKRATLPVTPMPAPIALLLHRLASAGPPGYIPDLGLWGSGLHDMPAGSPGLGWHADAERHAILGLQRTLSGILYLEGDGTLFLRDGASVNPAPGRLATFNGEAKHMVGPVTTRRRSMAMFWYGPPLLDGRTRAAFEAA